MIFTANTEPVTRTYALKKAKRKIKMIDRDRVACKKARIKLRRVFETALQSMAASVAKQIFKEISKADQSEIDRILHALNLTDFVDIYDDVESILSELAKDGAVQALIQIGMADNEALINQVNERAVSWAKEHSADMVGKKWIGGELVDNPNETWTIAESTREMLRANVADAIDQGLSNDALAENIIDAFAFSDDRAMMIARTETAIADIQGNVVAYQESGIVSGKEWITADDDQVSEDCQANADDGVVPLDDAFTSGALWPPDHPNCRCDVVPDLIEEDQINQEDETP